MELRAAGSHQLSKDHSTWQKSTLLSMIINILLAFFLTKECCLLKIISRQRIMFKGGASKADNWVQILDPPLWGCVILRM